jgi:hypothetical protein
VEDIANKVLGVRSSQPVSKH